MKSPLRCLLPFCFIFLATCLFGKDAPPIVMYWPSQEKPTLKVTFNTFRQVGDFGGKRTLLSDVIVQNVSDKPIPHASFTVYMLDKDKVRIGNGVLIFDDLTPGEATKVQFQCATVGLPVALAGSFRDAEGIPSANKVVPLKIISVPTGAKLTVDDKDEGDYARPGEFDGRHAQG